MVTINNDRLVIDNLIFDFVYDMALNDALNRTSDLTKGDKIKISTNKDIRCVLKKHAESIINGDKWSLFKTVNLIQAKNQNNTNKVDNLYFGKIQKLINMTMKYVYIKYSDDISVGEMFSFCDAPMDSIMRDFVYESYIYLFAPNNKPSFKKSCAWSSIGKNNSNFDDYNGFQLAIKNIIEDKKIKINGKIINSLQFDYLFWEKAKGLGEKSSKEQKELVKSIWEKYEENKDNIDEFILWHINEDGDAL